VGAVAFDSAVAAWSLTGAFAKAGFWYLRPGWVLEIVSGSIYPEAMSRRPVSRRRPRNFRSGDAREAVLQGMSAVSARLLPQRSWVAASDFQARLFPNSSPARIERFRQSVRAVLGEAYVGSAVDIRRQVAIHTERRRLYVAALRAGERWTPSIELIGLENVLRSRVGVILWFDHLAHYSVPGKMAFARAGHPVWHLSSHTHGLSATRFGVRFLNPRLIKVEDRFIRGRIAFDERTLVATTRRLVELLDDGGIVSITNNASLGHAVAVPLGETASTPIATTPLKLALRGKAALFPVSVLETEPLKSYRVTIGPAITPPPAGTADPIAAMLAGYTDHLISLIRAHPDQWAAWRTIA
jgi:lauroyl/myristoyl acyltransferase